MDTPNKNEPSTKVTELKKKLSEEQSKNSINTAILEGGTLIIWAVDENHDLISFNQNYFNSFMSSSPNSKIGELISEELVEIKERDFWQKKYDQALKGQSLNFEIKIKINKATTWKEVFLNPIYESTGDISGVSGLAYDITEKMESKMRLVESERMFRNIFQSFQDLYFRCDFSGKILMLSPSVFDITGYHESELLGKNITNYYLYKAKTKSLLRRLAIKSRVRNFEVDVVDKEGDIIYCICNVRLILDNNDKPLYIEGVARDITELKQTNKQLIKAKEFAEDTLKVKERFLANMSHEIRTPLNGIIGMIHLLDQPNLTDEQKKHVHSLKNSSEILLNILNDLLDLSKIEAGKMTLKYQPVDTSELMEKICELYREQARSNHINLKCSLSPRVPQYIFTDETKLLQVFANLVSNAIKFTHEGGYIDVSLTLLEKKPSGWVKLQGEVKDSGIGINENEQKQLFNSFTQLDSSSKKAFKGTGLGLYISKQLVELFNGDIKVSSTPGMGSTFSFTFESTATRIRPEKKTVVSKKLEGAPQIMVVDDNAINLELAAAILKNAGCAVTTCQSGAESIKIAQETVFDAILMDIQMPDIDGIMAARGIRSNLHQSTPPIIAMTAYSMEGDEQKFLKQGFDDYIAKPIKPEILIGKLEKWVSKDFNSTKRASSESRPVFESIDLSVLDTLKKYGGEETVREALNEFDKECVSQIKDSTSAFEKKNIKEVLNILHTLKGNAGTLGIKKIADQAEMMEDELKKEKYFIFDSEILKLKELYHNFKGDLNALFNQND